MRKFYYYARLNDNDVCIEIVSRVEKLKDVRGYVELPEYNETVRYRKWLGDQWSQETYEPSIDTVVQDKLEELEEENSNLKSQVSSLESTITSLESTITSLNATNGTLTQSIAELTTMIAILQVPTE